MTIPLPPYVPPFKPVPQVTPFTYRDGITMLKKLDGLGNYINKILVPWVNENYEALADEFEEEVNRLIEAVNAAIELIINEAIELQDPVMAGIIADLDSATRTILDSLYASKKIENSVPLNVKDFGALGDGVADDTAAIQSALTAAEYRTLIFPHGVYVISSPLRMKGNTELKGFNSTIKRKTGFTSTMLVNFDANNSVTTGYKGNGNIKISDFIFDGNRAATSSNMATFVHSHDVHVENCTFIECTGEHFLEFNSSRDCSAINSRFIGFIPDPALSFRKEAIQIDGAHDNLTGGGAKDGTTSKNVLISDCYFGPDTRGNGGPNICVGSHNVFTNKHENITIRNCVGEDLRAGGVWVGYGLNWNVDNCRFTTVVKPVIHYNEITLIRRGVAIGENSVDSNVSNCLINSADGCGVGIRGAAGDIIIANNLFYNGQNGIQVEAANYAIIESNLFYRSSGPAVSIMSSNHVTVNNNLIRGAGYPAGGLGVFVVDGASGATSQYNNFVSNIYIPNGATDPSAGVYSNPGFGGQGAIMNNRFRGLAAVQAGATTDVVLTNTLL